MIVIGLLKVIERLDELILEFNDLIPEKWCDLIVDWFHANGDLQKLGEVVDDYDNQEVVLDFKIAMQSIVPFETPMFDLITKINHMAYDKVLEKLPLAPKENIYFRDYSVRIYEKSKGIFKPHVDQHSGATSTRIFTIILYLNDVEEGGETEFITLNKKVKPQKGKVLVFPSNFMFPHGGNIPISNSKYIATSFLNFKPPDNFQ